MKKITILLLLFSQSLLAQPSRKEFHVPDILGYQPIKCDLHIHTVFSDGYLWPTYRVDEAWQEGLDAIAITDHIEYRPYLKEENLNKSYELALPRAQDLDILLIHGVEITKSMPPGHLNALFISDANTIFDKDPYTSVQNAAKQGAFIVWNHSGWKAQQPDTVKWWDIHTRFYNEGMLHGIEVVGYEQEYFKESHLWANEKNLTMIGGTDIHPPIKNEFTEYGAQRTMTIAFAKERSMESLKEAFFTGRTVVYSNGFLYGKSGFLEAIFQASVTVKPIAVRNKKMSYLMVYNSSDIPFQFEAVKNPDVRCIEKVTLKPKHTTIVEVKGISENVDQLADIELPISVENLYTAPGITLKTGLKIENESVK